MSSYDIEKGVKLVQFYYSNGRSIVQTQRDYRTHFNVRDAPSENMIRNLMRRFEESGSVADLPKRGSEHTVRTEAAVDKVSNRIQQHLHVVDQFNLASEEQHCAQY